MLSLALTSIGDLLCAGVVLAAAITLIGGVLYLTATADTSPNCQAFRGEPEDLRTVVRAVGLSNWDCSFL
jgi:hypothetical protein